MSYIDVDKFAEKICNFQEIDEDAANAMIWLLRTFPTADVVEVRHGYWTKTTRDWAFQPTNCKYEYICSACGERELDMRSFCPNCGAKMDGERREE